MLLSILYIYNQVGTTDYEVLLTFAFSDLEQKLLWFTFFLAFANSALHQLQPQPLSKLVHL